MTRHGLLEELFPPRYDFYKMLTKQSDLTANGIAMFAAWLTEPEIKHYGKFLQYIREADDVRMKLEEQLIEAFTTPFDRDDIYTFSVRMNRILECSNHALQAIQAYSVKVDRVIIAMADKLTAGTNELAQGTLLLESNPKEAGARIENMRKAHESIQSIYREALAELFMGNDPMETIKLREVYHEMREASSAFDLVVDVFHRIIVRLG